jgi:hypothetical protein
MNRSFEEPRVAAIGSYSYMITERGGQGKSRDYINWKALQKACREVDFLGMRQSHSSTETFHAAVKRSTHRAMRLKTTSCRYFQSS